MSEMVFLAVCFQLSTRTLRGSQFHLYKAKFSLVDVSVNAKK